jgi:hypothetical protein
MREDDMNKPSMQDNCSAVVAETEQQWPRDFDFREAYAEQRELLDAQTDRTVTPMTSKGAECHE